jgi:hypothetical protein
MVFNVDFNPTALLTPKSGTPSAGGGWTGLGTGQTNWGTPDNTVYKYALGEVCSYTVSVVPSGWYGNCVTLTFVPKTINGYKPLEVDKTGVIGSIIPVTITGAPEPMTLSLLGLSGLVLVRRRPACPDVSPHRLRIWTAS